MAGSFDKMFTLAEGKIVATSNQLDLSGPVE